VLASLSILCLLIGKNPAGKYTREAKQSFGDCLPDQVIRRIISQTLTAQANCSRHSGKILGFQVNEVSNKSGDSPKASRVCAFLSSLKVVLEQVKASSFLESSPRLRSSLPLPEEATFGRAALPRQKLFTRDSSDVDGTFCIDGAFWLPG